MNLLSRRKKVIAYALNAMLLIITWPFNILRRKRKVNWTKPTILISRPDHIGDLILSTPIYHTLKEKFPDCKIILICGSWAEPIVQNNPYIDKILVLDCPWWTSIRKDASEGGLSFYRRYMQTLRDIKDNKPDIFIELRGDIRHSFLFGWVPNIPVRISNNRSGGSFLLTHVEQYKFDQHEIEKNYQLLNIFSPYNKYLKTEIFPDISTIDLFNRFNVEEKYVVIFNGGRSALRRLDVEKVINLIQRINNKYGYQCVLVGSKEDYYHGSIISKSIKEGVDFLNLCGKLSLMEVKCLIDKACLFIGNDSSVSHIFASSLTPGVSLYGPMLPDQVKPLGERKYVVFHRYPCSPCLQTKCLVTGSPVKAQCMHDISIEEIMESVKELLKY